MMAERTSSWRAPKEARMVPREKAAFAYTETVRQRVDPAIMEWAGAGVFSARVFPLAAHKIHRIVVGYDVDLTKVLAESSNTASISRRNRCRRPSTYVSVAQVPGVNVVPMTAATAGQRQRRPRLFPLREPEGEGDRAAPQARRPERLPPARARGEGRRERLLRRGHDLPASGRRERCAHAGPGGLPRRRLAQLEPRQVQRVDSAAARRP